jgi:hypothetical protein
MILSDSLWKQIEKAAQQRKLSQPRAIIWSGGYFGFQGTHAQAASSDDTIRVHWRQEYLPGPTAVLATSLSAAIAGALIAKHAAVGRLRVTLHRTIKLWKDEVLQQCCDYRGTEEALGTAGRTFPAHIATIGLAYRCRRVIRSVDGVSRERLRKVMATLDLNAASRSMSQAVSFVLAIPILEPELPKEFTEPWPVAGVLYVDSTADAFYVDDSELASLVSMVNEFVRGLERSNSAFDRIRNVPLSDISETARPPKRFPRAVEDALELVQAVDPPRSARSFQFNFDYSDFVPIRGDS